MVSENMKFDYKPKETHCFLDAEKLPPTSSNSKIKLFFWVLPLLVILVSSFVLSLYSVLKMQNMKDEVDYLRLEVDKLRRGLVDDDLFDDIKKFENDEELYPDEVIEDRVLQPWLVNGGDDLEQDYDSNYDEEEDEIEGMHKFINDEIIEDKNNNEEESPDHEDLTNLMTGGSFTKIGKETARSRRDVIASTYEGVPINSESYADMKKKNKTRPRITYQDNLKFYDHIKPLGGDGVHSAIPKLEGSYHSSSWINKHHATQGLTHYEQLESKNPTPPPAPVVSRRSRVMHVEDKSKAFRRVVKKPQLKSGSQMETVERRKESGGNYMLMPALRHYYLHQEQVAGPEFTVVRDDQIHHRRNRHRQRNNLETLDERPRTTGRMKPLPAIHFSGDTSKYVLGRHTNFNGDGHLRHPDQTFVDWAPSDWVKSLNMDEHFQLHEGYLKIKENGLYFVYAQIYYLDDHDTNGYRVHKNQETLLQCTTMTHSSERVLKGNTCYTAGVEYLNEGDQISVRDLADGRYSLFEVGKSFFGAVKLGDIKIK